MTQTDAPSAIELSKHLIDSISKAVAEGGDAAEARAALADILQGQDPASVRAKAESKNDEEADKTALTLDEESIQRPNGETYWVRKIGIHTDVAVLREARSRGVNLLAYGPPGTGKTALIEAAYASEGGVWTIQGTGDTEVADLIGSHVQLPNGQFEWVDGPLLCAMEAGGVAYVDEIALIDPKALAILYGVMDGRGELRITQNPERGVVKAADGFYVAAACNPNAPGARMSEALISRFPLQFEVGTDYNLARKLDVPPKMVTAAQNLHRKFTNGELSWVGPQLRELLAFRDVADMLGEDVALANVVAGAPEIDRPVVADILSRSYARVVKPLEVD